MFSTYISFTLSESGGFESPILRQEIPYDLINHFQLIYLSALPSHTYGDMLEDTVIKK